MQIQRHHAAIPQGCESVVPVEWTERDGRNVVIKQAPKQGQHIRRAGEEITKGEVLLAAGARVTPRTTRDGVTARLVVCCGDDTQLYEMTAAPDGSFAADGIVFTVGSTYELSVQWTADGVTTNETLGTVDFNDEMTEPQIIWGAVGSSLDFGYSVQRVGNKQYRLTLTCYPVEVQVDAPPWMQPAQVEIDLRLNGDAGEPTATAVLDCEGESSYGNSSRTESVWNGTFYSEEVVNGWEYDGETLPKYVVRVTDMNGNVWTEEMPLSKR